jgi:copper transporter 1
MLFTWDTTNLCIVFPSWRVTGTLSLIVSLLAVVALTAGYEAIREASRRYEERCARNVQEAPRKFLLSFFTSLAQIPPIIVKFCVLLL